LKADCFLLKPKNSRLLHFGIHALYAKYLIFSSNNIIASTNAHENRRFKRFGYPFAVFLVIFFGNGEIWFHFYVFASKYDRNYLRRYDKII